MKNIFFKFFVSKPINRLFWGSTIKKLKKMSCFNFKNVVLSILLKLHKKKFITAKMAKMAFLTTNSFFQCILKNTKLKDICMSIVYQFYSARRLKIAVSNLIADQKHEKVSCGLRLQGLIFHPQASVVQLFSLTLSL